jgi:GR25 family glycosyltransferase involved in LPS biosynthesis
MDAYYINLDRRPDRRAEMQAELTALKLPAIRFPAVDQAHGVGCMKSHLAVLKEARDRNLPSVLIFEDDFECLVSPDTFWTTISMITENHPCDVLMLSYNLLESENVSDAVLRVLDAQTASGYIVFSKFYDMLIACFEKHLPLLDATQQHWLHANDQCWKPLQRTHLWLAPKIRLGKQRESFSDNSNTLVNYNC